MPELNLLTHSTENQIDRFIISHLIGERIGKLYSTKGIPLEISLSWLKTHCKNTLDENIILTSAKVEITNA